MRRTSIAFLSTLAVLGAAIAWLADVALANSGYATVIAPTTLTIGLFGIAAIVIAFGWPVRQTVRGHRLRPVDPFVAMRVLVLAKACSLLGALLTGAGIGVLVYGLSRAVSPAGSSIFANLSALAGAIVLTVAGLVVEHWCRIPPIDDAEVEEARGLQRN